MLKSCVPATNLQGRTARVSTGNKLLRTYEPCVLVVRVGLGTFKYSSFSILKTFYRDENSIRNK